MKQVFLLLGGLALGYVFYPLLNPKIIIPEIESTSSSKSQVSSKAQEGIEATEKAIEALESKEGATANDDSENMTQDSGNGVQANQKNLAPEDHGPQTIYQESIPKFSKEDAKKSFEALKKAPYLRGLNATSKKLLGNFTGTLQRKDRIDTVIMNLNLRKEGMKLVGDAYISLTDATGFEYSNKTGSGSNQSIKGIKGTTDSYFVEVSPDSYFLLNLASYPEVTGRFYEKGEELGVVTLTKSNLE